MTKKKIVMIIIILWCTITAALVISSEYILNTGREVLLKIVPVDPRDMLRGDYVILNYEISSYNRKDYKPGSDVYVSLNVDKKKNATMKKVHKEKPSGEFFIKGKIKKGFANTRIEYGIESYFVKEYTGKEIEKKLQKGAKARVLIDRNGNAKVKELVY